jgi:flagellar biogenesis protein FliO
MLRRPGGPGFDPRFIIRHSAFVLLSLAANAYAAPLAVYGTTNNLPPVSTALPDAGLSLIRVFGALAFVLALFLGGVWLFKSWQRVALKRQGRAPNLEVLETRALGNRHILHVVGYQQQRLLIAASPNGVTLLSHLPHGEAAEPSPAPAEIITSPNFLQSLQQAIQKRS